LLNTLIIKKYLIYNLLYRRYQTVAKNIILNYEHIIEWDGVKPGASKEGKENRILLHQFRRQKEEEESKKKKKKTSTSNSVKKSKKKKGDEENEEVLEVQSKKVKDLEKKLEEMQLQHEKLRQEAYQQVRKKRQEDDKEMLTETESKSSDTESKSSEIMKKASQLQRERDMTLKKMDKELLLQKQRHWSLIMDFLEDNKIDRSLWFEYPDVSEEFAEFISEPDEYLPEPPATKKKEMLVDEDDEDILVDEDEICVPLTNASTPLRNSIPNQTPPSTRDVDLDLATDMKDLSVSAKSSVVSQGITLIN
jgi:hypothetical protein